MANWSQFVISRLDGKGGKARGSVRSAAFKTLENKWTVLRERCSRTGELVGGQVNEVFRVGGDKNVVWFDIDTHDWRAFRLWEQSVAFPFPHGSYVTVPSSTGRIHVFVSVDRPLSRWAGEQEIREIVARKAPKVIAERIDCVAGQNDILWFYLPGCSSREPVMPQKLLESTTTVWNLPDHRGTEMEEYAKRKRLRSFVESYLLMLHSQKDDC